MKTLQTLRPLAAPAPVAVLQRCACGRSPGPTGECAECRRKRPLGLQPKLRVGVPGDRYEREADRVAEAVVRSGPAPTPLPITPLVQRAGGDGAATTAPPEVHAALAALGRPLDGGTRAALEPRLGHDLGGVRIHTGGAAARAAEAVQARAFTVGRDVVFGTGEYRPGTVAGRRLLAHELAHVVQQQTRGPALQRNGGPSQKQPPKKCPDTYTIPDDVHKAVEAAWAKSGHGSDTVAEHGGRIVTDKAGKRVIRTGSGGSGSISLPPEKAGDTTTGTFHTHPYSKAEGSELGVSFSAGDLNNFIQGGQGTVKYVGAGTCIFTVKTADQGLQDACKKEDIKKRWNDAFGSASGTFQEKVHAGVKAAIAGCGICYYQACRPDKKSPIPKSSQLVA